MTEDHEHRHHHGSTSAGLANWRGSNLPFFRKLKVAFGNNWIKLRRRQACCGHPGEPGC